MAGLLGGGLLLVAASMAASIADRADVPVEAVSATTVTVAVGAVILVGAGVLAFALSKSRDIVLLSAAATFLILLSIAGLFSIGLLVLPFAVGAVFLLVRRSSGRGGLVPSLFAGPAIAVGLSLLFVVWVQPPVVECTEGGASTNSRPWWSEGTSSGEETSVQGGAGRASSGSIETPSGRYVFRCTDGELTQFRPIGRG